MRLVPILPKCLQRKGTANSIMHERPRATNRRRKSMHFQKRPDSFCSAFYAFAYYFVHVGKGCSFSTCLWLDNESAETGNPIIDVNA